MGDRLAILSRGDLSVYSRFIDSRIYKVARGKNTRFVEEDAGRGQEAVGTVSFYAANAGIAMSTAKYDEGIDKASPSQDTTDRFFEDQRLREYGFVIHSRKKGKSVIWIDPQGVKVSHKEAMRQIRAGRWAKKEI